MDCSRCSALLPPKSNICTYCGAVNDTDLKGFRIESSTKAKDQRECPRCNCKLEAIVVETGNKILVDRCSECYGIFFDIGEFETILTEATENIFESDHLKLKKLLIEEKLEKQWPVSYLECPDCDHRMNREVLGSLSGIVIDKCRDHGIWLDGGELGRALKWYKAGGKIRCDNIKEEKKRLSEALKGQEKDNEAWFTMTTKGEGSFSKNESLFFELISMLSKKV